MQLKDAPGASVVGGVAQSRPEPSSGSVTADPGEGDVAGVGDGDRVGEGAVAESKLASAGTTALATVSVLVWVPLAVVPAVSVTLPAAGRCRSRWRCW